MESVETILSRPWLKDSIYSTNTKWGNKIADVELGQLPINILGQVLLVEGEENKVRVIVYRCDRYDHLGWDKEFPVTLTFPDSSQYEIEIPPSFRIPDGHSITVEVKPGTIVRERTRQDGRTIPRIIYNLSAPPSKQISHEVRRLLKNNRRMTNLLQQTSLFLVLEDYACEKEVENSGIENFVEAYNSLRAPSYKADLVRYYLLYRYGGVYLDDKTLLRTPLDSSVFDSLLGTCDFFIAKHYQPEIAFMGARRGSPIMLRALENAITRIMRREYTDNSLGITGNVLMSNTLSSVECEEYIPDGVPKIEGITWVKYLGERTALIPITISNNGVLVNNRYLWQRQAIASVDWPKPKTHYSSLWARGLVYTEGNPDINFNQFLVTSWDRIKSLLPFIVLFGFLFILALMIKRYPSTGWLS